MCTGHEPLADHAPIPFDTEARGLGRMRAPLFDIEPRGDDSVELRDIFEKRRIRHRTDEAHVQLHQEMRADRHVEPLGHVGNLEPGGDAADPGDVGLHDAGRALFEIILELRLRIHALAHCDGHTRVTREQGMGTDVIGGHRFLEPVHPCLGQHVGAAHRLGEIERLVGIDHHPEILANRRAHLGQPGAVFSDRRLADLELSPVKAFRLHLGGVLGQRFSGQVQPTTLGGVEWHRRLRPPGQTPKRQPGAAAAQIPKRRVDCGERKGRDRPHSGGMSGEQEIAPDRLDLFCLSADQPGRECAREQAHGRRAARPDGVGIAHPLGTIAVDDPHERRFLAHERLDRIDPLHGGR
ncbi:MAG: hypothetical protein AUK37_06190 [Rhodobacterales bacterium CG2_30_65_12]|nr:MAG: hypothetical protein AUK37_06190 [Rhodobacterales bacterium CG2_30_65_12]